MGLLFVGLTLAASSPHAEADAEIAEALAFEAPDSRRMALSELKLLTPAILLGAAAILMFVYHHRAAGEWLARLVKWRAGDDWQPVLGLSTGLAGWVIGGAVGWLAGSGSR